MDGADAVGCAGVGVVEPHGFGLFFCDLSIELFSCFACLVFAIWADCGYNGSGSGVEIRALVAGIWAFGYVGGRPTTAFAERFFGLRVAVVAGEEAE